MPIYRMPRRRAAIPAGHFRASEPLLNGAYERLRDMVKAMDYGRRLHWTQAEAERHRDVAQKRCIRGVPLNVYCGRCEP
jgi:hypothetical protein